MDYALRRRAYLFLLNKLRVPRRPATAIVKGLAYLTDPLPAHRRRRAAAVVDSAGVSALAVPESAGYRRFEPDDFPGTAAMLEECRRIFQATRASGTLDRQVENASKRFLVPVAPSGVDLLALPAIRDFALSDPLLAVVMRYFGRVPILSELQLLWTPVNETKLKSQKYHLDTEDYRQLKVFVNIFDVTPESGPFTLIPADRSAHICRAAGYAGGRRERLEDETVERHGGGADAVSCLGKAGSSLFVDTSRCVHYGSRGNRSERLVLLLQFADYYASKLQPTDWRPVAVKLAADLDPPRRMLLRC